MTGVVSSATTAACGKFGKLWSRGYESFTPLTRSLISIRGKNCTSFLQGLVSCDLTSLPRQSISEECYVSLNDKDDVEGNADEQGKDFKELGDLNDSKITLLRSATFLDNRGRILSDALVWQVKDEEYVLDVSKDSGRVLLDHLGTYRRGRTARKIEIEDITDKGYGVHSIYGTRYIGGGGPDGWHVSIDPRHPSMGLRLLSPPHNDSPLSAISDFPETPGTYSILRKLCGIAEGYNELSGKTALEANQDWLNAISFKKGCYLGQELTARSNFTGIIRKRILPLIIYDDRTQIPAPWLRAGNDGTPLPRLSVVDAATTLLATQNTPLSHVLSSSRSSDKNELLENQEDTETKNDQEMDERQAQLEEAFSVKGAKLLDAESSDTIGEIISPMSEGSSVVLAQMRMDRVGITKGKKGAWSALNKIIVKGTDKTQNRKEWRYLPYLPLWWPPVVDPKTGKEGEISSD